MEEKCGLCCGACIDWNPSHKGRRRFETFCSSFNKRQTTFSVLGVSEASVDPVDSCKPGNFSKSWTDYVKVGDKVTFTLCAGEDDGVKCKIENGDKRYCFKNKGNDTM